jgi:hypothetical protein
MPGRRSILEWLLDVEEDDDRPERQGVLRNGSDLTTLAVREGLIDSGPQPLDDFARALARLEADGWIAWDYQRWPADPEPNPPRPEFVTYRHLQRVDNIRLLPAGVEAARRGSTGSTAASRRHEEDPLEPEQTDREQFVRVEGTIVQYVDADRIRSRYPLAYQRWKEAAVLLWGSDATAELTTIGHKLREAIQEFATALAERENVSAAESNPQNTVARLRAVIATRRTHLGTAPAAFLDALVSYWGTVSDLVQRQEHGAQREGEPLEWEDGRRAVFQTALVMYEIDRAVGGSAS